MEQPDGDPDRLTPQEVRQALNDMSAADWKRAERLAYFVARGLVGADGEDVLTEACTQLLEGVRRFPRSVSTLKALKSVMRSVASNIRVSAAERRRNERVAVEPEVDPDTVEATELRRVADEAIDRRTPEREALAKEEFDTFLSGIENDSDAQLVAMAWAEGLRGAAAIEATGLDSKVFDAARKRLMRNRPSGDNS